MLIICEKPSVAEDFAKTFSCPKTTKKDGYFKSPDSSVTVTFCFGHLLELAEPHIYDPKFKQWNLDDLPILPKKYLYAIKPDAKKQFSKIKELVNEAISKNQKIIIATDADREGELIARLVINKMGCQNYQNYFRFWASEALTPDVIQKELKKVQPWDNYLKLYHQGKNRQIADWLIGINVTRFVSTGNSQTFPVGRVQTALLAAVATRNTIIKNFQPQPYNMLEIKIQDSLNNILKAYLINPETKKTTFSENNEYLKKILQNLQNEEILEIIPQTKDKILHSPELFNTTGLQKYCSKHFDYSPDKTLELMQSLYEKHKCLSYPRTPSTVMGDDNVELFKTKYDKLSLLYPDYKKDCNPARITGENKRIFNSKKLEAHHALIPLDRLPDTASPDEKNVYNAVLLRFFMTLMDDNIIQETIYLIKTKNAFFKATVNINKQQGWKKYYSEQKSQNDEIQTLENFDYKNKCKILSGESVTKYTTPPKEFTEESLLGFMENPKNEKSDENTKLVGLGTQATRSSIIQNLFENRYLEKIKKNIFATKKGIYLLNFLQKSGNLVLITNISQTTSWEKELSENPESFLNNITNFVNESCRNRNLEVYQEDEIGQCPFCHKPILEGKQNYYCSGYKSNPPCSFRIWKKTKNTNFTKVDVKKLLNKDFTSTKNCVNKDGKKYQAKFKLNNKGDLDISFVNKKKQN